MKEKIKLQIPEEIQEIRRFYATKKFSQSLLSDVYDVTVDIIYNIVHRRNYKNI